MTDTHASPGRSRAVVLGAFALSGCAALAYEVVWTRALATVLGSTTYALATMLSTFMLGLALGGILGGRLAERRGDPLGMFALAELGIGALGIGSHLVIEAIPALHLAAYRAFHLSAPAYFTMQVVLCALVMLAPTILMGSTFPLVTKALVTDVREVGRTVGLAYGVNTLGSVVGSLLAGFVLVPGLGLRGATLVAAGVNATVGALMLARRGAGRRRLALLLVLVYVPLAAAAMSAERGSTLINFLTASRYLNEGAFEEQEAASRSGMRMVFEREGAGGYVAAYRTDTGHLVLQVGGKLEGTTAADMDNTILLGVLPAAAHAAPRSALVIGLGAGVTLQVARRLFPRVEVAEINDKVVEVVRRHGPPGVLEGVTVYRDDARHLLTTAERRWDVITSEPSYPTEFAVANLFSLEFYRLAAARLEPRGVFCQWLPYYALTNDDVTMMVKTFATAFPYASLWKVEGSLDLLLLGSTSAFARTPPEIAARVVALHPERPLDLKLSRSPEQVREIAALAEVPSNTDDHPRLEFAVARNFLLGDLSLGGR
jgi:spermidine synthase